MARGKIIIHITCIHFGLLFNILQGQELNPVQQKYLEEIIERIADNNDNSPDLTTLFDDLNAFLRQPLNLNSASKEEFNRLHLLNDFQIAMIMDYRKVSGLILSVHELLYIPGFRDEDVELLQSFVVAGNKVMTNSEPKLSLKSTNHMFVLRYQRVLEKQTGYKPVADSVLRDNPYKTRYLGSPDKLYFRYRVSNANTISAGFIAEKDAGEEFFKGSNRHGFDFYSAYLSYKNDETFIKKLVIGDYHVQAGQGLLLWSSYAMGKSSYIDQLPRRSNSIIPNNSVDENRFLRGAAIELGKGRFTFNLFSSYKSFDATLADTSTGTNSFESFRETGLHSTPSEIKNEKSVVQTTIGSGINFKGNRFSLGLNGYYTLFSKKLLKSDQLYKAYSFSGMELAGSSISYLYLGKKFQLFGESAIANDSYSVMNGLLVFLNHNFLLGTIHRYYQPSYYSFYSNAFSEGTSVSNEKGFFLGGEIRFSSFTLKTYCDIFSFPWLKYHIDAPSDGNDFFIELTKQYSKTAMYFRYRRREKPTNYNSKIPEILIGTSYKNQLRFNFQYWLAANLRVQNRIEMMQVYNPAGDKNRGFLILQDFSLKAKRVPIDLAFRVGYFNTTDYDARIYAYEHDVRFAYTNQLYYGKGWRFVTMAKWHPNPFVTLWLRISQSYFPGSDSVGSNLTEIKKNHRTEIKLQTIIKF